MKMVHITKVVTRNIIMDFVAKIQNMLGLNLTSYEKMINKGIEEIELELKAQNIQLKWYRYTKDQLTNGAMAITLYGERK